MDNQDTTASRILAAKAALDAGLQRIVARANSATAYGIVTDEVLYKRLSAAQRALARLSVCIDKAEKAEESGGGYGYRKSLLVEMRNLERMLARLDTRQQPEGWLEGWWE